MTLEQLRLTHPQLVYKSYDIVVEHNQIVITHEFLLEPDIVFRPKVSIPYVGSVDKNFLAPYIFHLGLVEAISYWKAACPKEFIVEAGSLTQTQIRFWYDLFLHGLGEFYYQNKIDFTVPDFLKIVSKGDKGDWPAFAEASAGEGDLVLVGGGKDSAVTLGILKESDRTIQTMVLNPTEASLLNIKAAGYKNPIVVIREIDSKLLELNNRGYLNGHTPFSAYLAFLGSMVAALFGYENVIVSNEKSANEGNVMYRGLEINHQYSKSFRFETMFREYALSIPGIKAPQFRESVIPNYFSFLRPLNDLQIAKLFSSHPMFFATFRSCNVGSKLGVWCGKCPKCAFTYLSLSPYLLHEQMVISFGGNLLEKPEILEHIRGLVGLNPIKPFECVGTRDESKLAVILTIGKFVREHREVPEGLLLIKSDLALTDAEVADIKHAVLDDWGGTYHLPEEYVTILRNAWKNP